MSGWKGSTRRARLPADWKKRRARVLRRDRYQCQIAGPDEIPCLAPANEVDHIEPGDDHRLDNLQAACHECHKRKTIEERPTKTKRRRPPEAHPGFI